MKCLFSETLGLNCFAQGKYFYRRIQTNIIFVLFYKQSCEYLIFGGLRPGFFPEDQKNKVAFYVRAPVHSGRN